MKSVKGSGVIAAVLTLLHGFYIPLHFLWVLVLIQVGLFQLAPPYPNPIIFAILDTIVYLFIGVGMLRGRNYFVFAILWSIWGAVLGTFAATYQMGIPNLLSFLVVLSCVYYHVSNNKTNSEVAKTLGRFAAILALIQGIVLVIAFALGYTLLQGLWIILVPPFNQMPLAPSFIVAAATTLAYLILGIGMLIGREEFFFLGIFWTIIESALAIASPLFLRTHYNILSIFTLAFAAYYYFAKTKRQ